MITLPDIQAAHARIRNFIIHTPLIHSSILSSATGGQVYMKLETLQKSGSFKVRGAMNAILLQKDRPGVKEVITASAGNHAQGVAIAARMAGIPATVIMPEWASISKQEATRGYGATVYLSGRSIEESVLWAMSCSDDHKVFIHPFDDEDVIAGQGTIGLEVLADLPDPDLILVPVGGGGLISGITVAIKTKHPLCRIIGVQSEACPSAAEAMTHGQPVQIPSDRTIADGIRVTKTGGCTFPIIRDHVDRIICVSDDEVSQAMLWLLERKKIMSEGAGAVPLAALLSGKILVDPGARIVLVISGGNVDSHHFFRIIRHSLVIQERLLRVSVILDNQPGSLARLLCIIGCEGGNILQITHNPDNPGNSIQTVQVDIEMETRGSDHTRSIERRIKSEGFRMVV